MQKLLFQLLFSIGCLVGLAACSKGDSTPVSPAPENLTLSATVATDSSGNVSFVASAKNAVSYEFDLGNGVTQTSSNGNITYKYSKTGLYQVNVTAKGAGNQTIATGTDIVVFLKLTLFWSDEFDGSGAPDATKWGYDIGAGGWGNSELQYYTNRTDNAAVSNGTLKIIAKRESFSGSPYTSARLLSKGKFSFQYGKIECRAKLPADAGTWPAFWMLGDNITSAGWPACGEIDIMEHKGNDLNKIYVALHYPGRSGGQAVSSSSLKSNVATEFHTYTAIWSPDIIQFFYDGTPLFSTGNSTTTMPFNQKFFVILNMAMGGTFGGAVDPQFTSAQYEVDYVRVYR
jgi:beta-glucanase (GH16 family)